MDDIVSHPDCACSVNTCDTSTNSPHQVAFAPQAAKASNCQYFAVSTPRIFHPGAIALLLENPCSSQMIFYVTIQSVSNYGEAPITAHLVKSPDFPGAKYCHLDILSANFGCQVKSAAVARYAGISHGASLCKTNILSRDIVDSLHTLRIDHQGGFVVTPGSALAVVVTGICSACADKDYIPACTDVGIDLQWWETPCNSHA